MNRYPSIFFILFIIPLAAFVGLWSVFSLSTPVYADTHTATNTNNSGAGSLRQAVLDAQAGDVIEFAAELNGQTITLDAQIVLNKSLTIRSSFPIIISGNNATRIFSVANAEIVLEGLTLEKGAVQTDDCGGVSDLCGGAIIIQSAGGVLTVKDSTLRQNAANYGSGIYNNEGVLVVVDTTLEENVAQVAGAGIYQVGGTLTVFESVVAENSAELYGAGVYGTGAAVAISQTQLLSNTLSDTANSLGGGMAIVSDSTLTLHETTFTGNGARQGSGLYIKEGVGHITDSTFSHNKFSLSQDTYGGGMFSELSHLTVAYSSFTGNEARYGGGIQSSSYLTITHSTLTDNMGSGLSNGGFALVEETLIQGNESSFYGGGIDHSYGQLELNHSEVLSNTNLMGTGGGIRSGGGNLMISHTTVAYNQASIGGGIYGKSFSDFSSLVIHIVHSAVVSNTAANTAGGIYNVSGLMTIDQSSVSHNTTDGIGGGIYNGGSGGILDFGATTLITNSMMTDNRASSGGAIYQAKGFVRLSASTVANNRAYVNGGGIYHGGSSFYNCQQTPSLEIHNSTLSGNQTTDSTSRGGGLYTIGFADISHTTITQNEAQNEGSGVWSKNGMSDCTHVAHSVLAGNLEDDVYAENSQQRFISLGYNLIGVVAGQVDLTQEFNSMGDQTGVSNPGLLPLANNGGPTLTHALAAASPALDAGGALCAATDQRGVARPQRAACDIGAVEMQLHAIYLPLIVR